MSWLIMSHLIWIYTVCKRPIITKTYLHNVGPLKPHFYILKLGFTGVYIIFLISAQKHRLWVLVRTTLPIWVLSSNIENIRIFVKKFSFFLVVKFSIHLNRLVFVICFWSAGLKELAFTTYWANSADNKLVMFFLRIFPRKQDLIWHFICMKCLILFSRKNKKIFLNVVCWKFFPECQALNSIILCNIWHFLQLVSFSFLIAPDKAIFLFFFFQLKRCWHFSLFYPQHMLPWWNKEKISNLVNLLSGAKLPAAFFILPKSSY